MNSLLRENRVFPPPAEFAAKAYIGSMAEYETLYRRSIDAPDEFWRDAAAGIDWFTPFTNVLTGEIHNAQWFTGGTLNLCHNCVDRHVETRASHPAILWEGEPAEVETISFAQLHDRVQRFANVLKQTLGVKKGDRVAIYMGMCPELAVALLACARIGAVHSVIFGGFAAHAISDRVNDSQSVAVLTQDGSWRRGTEVKLKAIVDEALLQCPSVRHVLVHRRTNSPIAMKPGRDLWLDEALAAADPVCPCESMDSEDPLYILYTSGTTGKPKGLVHTTGGYSVGTYLTSKYVFDLRPDDVYWCTADIGWVTGHSYVLYGPLQNGVTTLMYEGAPNFPDNARFWKIVDHHKVSIFYTAPDRHPRLHQVGRFQFVQPPLARLTSACLAP